PAAPTALSVDWWGSVSGTATYTYTGVTQASTNHTAWFCDVDDSTPAELTTPNSQVELTDAQYGNLVTSDNVRAASVDPGAGDEIFTKSSFTINQVSSSVTAIDLTVEIQSNLASTFSIFAYDFIGATWVQVGATTASIPANTDTTILRSITTGAGNYVSTSNEVRWGCYQTTSTELVRVDYAMIQVTYSQYSDLNDNTLNWTLSADDGAGADDVALYNIYRATAEAGPWTTLIASVPAGTETYLDAGRGQSDGTVWWYVVRAEDTSGNEELNVLAVPEPSAPTAYSINLAGKLPNSWVFVSFPSGLSGNIQDILNDATAGDGLTTWAVAKWYNPQDPADPWKSYRVGGTANDMPTLTNAMGVWLWITANGGDQALTLSSYVSIPATNNINLYVGWNLVGYPSMTDRLGSTLPSQVDMLSVYSASAVYTDYIGAAIDPVTLHHGNAYFMHVTANTVWTVTNP
ncbi:MAG: hypothetical protein PHU53_06900, partial [Thermoplasmata archaeon]|nr:hypothetical protein [Thermoplasmata archaeon]